MDFPPGRYRRQPLPHGHHEALDLRPHADGAWYVVIAVHEAAVPVVGVLPQNEDFISG